MYQQMIDVDIGKSSLQIKDRTMECDSEQIEVFVKSVVRAAEGINVWEFCRLDSEKLPSFSAGAHIDLRLHNGLVRSYSLCNEQEERDRYEVAISKDAGSRGGSRFIHETLKIGDKIFISPPRNNFCLVEDARHVAFIAGGIGITPLWSMIQRLEKIGRSWEIHYSARNRHMCAFRGQLEALELRKPGRVHFNFDQEPGGEIMNLKALVRTFANETHLYCCGPTVMLDAFVSAANEISYPATHIHVEYFRAKEVAAAEGGFTVMLARSGKRFEVHAGETILQTLLDNNIDVPYACTEGVCGTCEVNVLEGTPDHRDAVLSPDERASNKTLMVCCSGSKSKLLVLDL